MVNMAGRDTATVSAAVIEELTTAGIPTDVDAEQMNHVEVKTVVIGRLGPFIFRRQWYYYAVHGPVPLDVARAIYATDVGKRDVRVAGHCGCPPPEKPWITRLDAQGRTVIPASDRPQWQQMATIMPEMMNRFGQTHIWDDDPDLGPVAETVTSYHIDSPEGLKLFVNFIRPLVIAQVNQ